MDSYALATANLAWNDEFYEFYYAVAVKNAGKATLPC